jgi:hypothetical protein
VINEIKRWQAKLADLPPTPRCIMASHLVPYGRVYRQWNTRGELLLWANRGEIADLPRAERASAAFGIDVAVSTLAPADSFGIPVVNA